jgi:hypothetical protein
VITYTQTRDPHLAQEAHIVVSRMTHNSPLEAKVDVKADVSATNVSEAITKLINGVTQAPTELKLKKLELAQKKQDMDLELAQKTQDREIAAREAALRERETTQQIEQIDKQFQLEQERLRLELEEQRTAIEKDRLENEKVRLAIIEQQLELQKKMYEYALQLAENTVGMQQPNLDPQAKSMLTQALVGNILQLQEVNGLAPALPPASNTPDTAP